MSEKQPDQDIGSTSAPSKKLDFSLSREILILTLPIAMGGHTENVVGMVEIFLIGMLGPTALSAVGLSQAFTRVLTTAMMSVSRGAMTMVAQAIGADSMEGASAAAKQAFTMLSLFSIVFCLGSLAISPFLVPLLSSDPAVIALGTPYLQIFFFGIPFRTLNRAITSCFQGAGNAQTPFYLSLFSSIVQIVVSYLLIFGLWGLPALGVIGAALAGFIARVLTSVVGLSLLYSGRFGLTLLPSTSYRFNWDIARRILRIGVPSGIQGIFRNGSGLVYLKLIALTAFSTTAVAAYTIGNQMERILRRTSLSFSTASTALVGQSLGARNPDAAERRGWTILLISIITSVILGLPIALFARPILDFFTDAPEVISMGIFYMYAMVLAEPLLCASSTAGGSLRGAGDAMPPLYYTMISQWLVRLPVAYVLAFTLGYDINGIWATLVIYGAVQGFLTVRKFARGEWKHKKI